MILYSWPCHGDGIDDVSLLREAEVVGIVLNRSVAQSAAARVVRTFTKTKHLARPRSVDRISVDLEPGADTR